MKEKTNITIHDLARELGVSPSTVSRALRDHPGIGERTRKAVKELAVLRGYRPNILAVNLRSQQSMTLGVLISWINRPFYGNLISGVEAAARERGYNVIISQTTDDTAIEIDTVKTLYDMRIGGIISCLALYTLEFEHFMQFSRSGTPLVFVDRVPNVFPAHKIVIDNFKAAHQATTHLIDQGCQKLAHIGGPLLREIYKDRLRGFKHAIRKGGLTVYPDLVLHGNYLDPEESRHLAMEILSKDIRPDGVFCVNDTVAVSVIQVARKMGLKIPEDLAIVGFNDDPVCEIIVPQLSSMYHPAYEMGKLAVKDLLAQIEGQTDVEEITVLEAQLRIRNSSLRKKSK